MTGGSTWDTLRHLKQHFEEFDPQAGGAALFTEFLVKKRWALLSGPVSHWDPEAQFTEWDLLLSTAILATREGVMYNRFLRVLEFMWFPFFGRGACCWMFLVEVCGFLEAFSASSGTLQQDCLRGRAQAGDPGGGEHSAT